MAKKNKKNTSKLKFLKIFLFIFLFCIIAVLLSYLIQKDKKSTKVENKKIEKVEKKVLSKKTNDEFDFEQIVRKQKKEQEETNLNIDKKVEEKLSKKSEKQNKQKESKKEKVNNEFIKKDLYKYDKKTKAKLAILIDDVSSSKQKKKVLSIGYKVGMAFLPPTKTHKNSAKIAQDLPFYMIHFPMQASSKFKREEKATLHIDDSYEKIEKRVKQLRAWYPKARYTNNHTGSVFTSNDKAMNRLFKALKKYDFIFVDSRTSSKSLAQKYAKKYNMPYIVRNIFLDNKKEYKYIQNQLKKAIKKAKKQGYAIAIGHPHSMTIKVLKESNHLLKDLDLIYVNELPYL